ncbi:MAG: hypothetical protein JSS38_08755 [Nitrospira sp.]|nr:hypothetical protein [Nitrospira sp.]
MRMVPGSIYAPHRHAGPEGLYVLEGGWFCSGQELAAGDDHRTEAGTEHPTRLPTTAASCSSAPLHRMKCLAETRKVRTGWSSPTLPESGRTSHCPGG